METLWTKIRNNKTAMSITGALLLFGLGFVFGSLKENSVQIVEHTVEDTLSKKKLEEANKVISSLQEQLTAMQRKYEEAKSHTKTVLRVVRQKDGTVIVDKTTETDSSKKFSEENTSSQTTNSTNVATNEKKEETDTSTHKDATKVTTPMKDKIYLGLSGGIGIAGVSNPGLEFKYRVLDLGQVSGWAGAEAVVPVPNFKWENAQLRLQLGISF